MGEAENQVVLDRLHERAWGGETHDFGVMDAVFADDAVVECPQSGERSWGRANIGAVEEGYPALPKVTIRRKLAGAIWRWWRAVWTTRASPTRK